MSVSLNSVIRFNPSANYQHVTRANIHVPSPKVFWITRLSGPVGLRESTSTQGKRYYLVASGGDNVVTETSDKDSKSIRGSNSNKGSSENISGGNSSAADDKIQSSSEIGVAPQVSQVSNWTVSSTNTNQEALPPSSSLTPKKAPLTARERLRAARVLGRYTETKPSKPELGSKLLEALQETEKKGKKRSGLPEAPTNLFDDSKRGMPKQGWTIDIPGGMDVFLIIISFVLISSIMFGTTYIVWKVGAIHFNEY